MPILRSLTSSLPPPGSRSRVELELFAQDVARSGLPAAEVVRGGGVTFESWDGALTFLATAAGDTPQVIVMDELPYLVEQDPSLEATLQKVWDRYLREAPVLLVLIGSDVSMVSALTEYDRPLYGRPTLEMVVEPCGPHETAEMLGLPAAEAMDAQLVLGGFPQITQEWRPGMACGTSWRRSSPTPPRRSSSAGDASYLRSSRRKPGHGRY